MARQLEFGFLKPEYQLICSAVLPLSREKDLLDLIFDGISDPEEKNGDSTSIQPDPAYLVTTSQLWKKLTVRGLKLDSYLKIKRSNSLRRPWRVAGPLSENGKENREENDSRTLF